jgi:quinol monooxygenase YgiN
MIVAAIRIVAGPDNIEEILEVLASVIGPTRGRPGCIDCRVYQDLEDNNTIVYEERWQNQVRLYRHLRSRLYTHVLAVIDMSAVPPEIQFNTIAESMGMELIKKARKNEEKIDMLYG